MTDRVRDLQDATNGALKAFGTAYVKWAKAARWQTEVRILRRRPTK